MNRNELKKFVSENYERALKERDNYRKTILDTLKSGNREVYLWGTGLVGIGFVAEMKAKGAKFTAYVDSNPEKWETVSKTGLPIISTNELAEKKNPLVIVTTARYSEDVFDALEDMGITDAFDATDFRLNFAFDDLKNLSPKQVAKNIVKVYDLLSDEESKQVLAEHILQFFEFENDISNSLKRPRYYNDLCRVDQYFPNDIIDISPNEVFIDCGAFDGDTMQDLLNSNRPFKQYIGYELSKKIFHRLQNNIKIASKNFGGGGESLIAFNLGVGEKAETVFYNDSETETSFSDTGEEGKLVALSEHLEKEKIIPTFIKMDLEGMEVAALKGGAEIIAKAKPKLAICVYHRISDLWTIPLYIYELNPSYKFYFRQHTVQYVEAVCYAVPT